MEEFIPTGMHLDLVAPRHRSLVDGLECFLHHTSILLNTDVRKVQPLLKEAVLESMVNIGKPIQKSRPRFQCSLNAPGLQSDETCHFVIKSCHFSAVVRD